MKVLGAFMAGFCLMAIVSVAGGIGSSAPSTSVNGAAVSPAFVDAGLVATPELDLRVGGAISLKEGTGGQAGALVIKAPIGAATTGGSGIGDFNVQGDFYVGNGLPFSVSYATGNVTPGGITIASNILPKWSDHSGGGYWDIANMTAALGNIDALGVYRTGSSNPYWWWDFTTGYSVSRFGIAIAAANDGTGQRLVPVAVPNDGGMPQVAIEYGRDVMSSGTKTVIFKNAFTVAPACFCQDGTAISACDVPISTISTTQAVINGTTTDKFSWFCIGDR